MHDQTDPISEEMGAGELSDRVGGDGTAAEVRLHGADDSKDESI